MRTTSKLLLFLLLCVGCTNESSSAEALDAMGFTDVHFTGYSFFACSKDDEYHTGFKAKNPSGKKISGTVCCGILKSCTVRF